MREGEYLGDQRLVRIQCEEAPEAINDLANWGARIVSLEKSPGHKFPRGVWIPGTEFVRILGREVRRRQIPVYELTFVTDLLKRDGVVVGAVGIGLQMGEFLLFKARAVVLATGGAQRIYSLTTAPDELTRGGLAMAYRVGA